MVVEFTLQWNPRALPGWDEVLFSAGQGPYYSQARDCGPNYWFVGANNRGFKHAHAHSPTNSIADLIVALVTYEPIVTLTISDYDSETLYLLNRIFLKESVLCFLLLH